MKWDLREGQVVLYQDEKHTIVSLGKEEVELVNYDGEVIKVSSSKVSDVIVPGINSISTISDEGMKEAKRRFDIIKKLVEGKCSRTDVELAAEKHETSVATIYRWIKKYRETDLVSSLAPKDRPGGRGKSRLNEITDAIIEKAIKEHHLTNQRKSFQKVYFEVKLICRERQIDPPHYNTVRRRIKTVSEYETTKHRLGKSAARKKFRPKVKKFPDDLFPLSSVQIDHTPLDLIVVDSQYRKPMGRPWLTLAIDSYSRMVTGFYLGMEKPNAMSVALCLSQSILPKEEYLAGMNIYSSWPCSGRIQCVHMDNALEFRSKILEEGCLEYQIDINWRPVATPEYGGHVERLLGTFSKDLHDLKGTTFGRFEKRGEYNSDKEAVFTFSEIEEWLTLYIVDFYHQKYHSGIERSPISKWIEGVEGSEEVVGRGTEPIKHDPRKVMLDFMPYEERTIQDYGIRIDGIHYYNDVLRQWINSLDIKSGKLRAKRKFKFKRDPRDVSSVYFLDPNLGEYFPISYRNTSHPPMTKWELQMVKSELKRQGRNEIDEDLIFETYKRLKEMEESAVIRTKKSRRTSTIKKVQGRTKELINPVKVKTPNPLSDDIFMDIEAFEDIEDGSFE